MEQRYYDELRRAILEKLRQEIGQKSGHQQVGLPDLHSLLPGRGILPRDEERLSALVYQIYHELYLERIIVPGTGSSRSAEAMVWPFYRMTEHGRQVLQTQEYSPYDANGYLARLKKDVPDIDETIVRYVAESLHCLRTDCLLAAAVTLGCASEKTMLLLIEQFGQAISVPAKKQEYQNKTGSWMISRKYKTFRESLDRISQDLPKKLRAQSESHLDGAFNLIRHVRNDAGHPSGEPLTRETIVANQTIFPGYCKYVYDLKAHLASQGVKLQ
jgi:hypothetical protein